MASQLPLYESGLPEHPSIAGDLTQSIEERPTKGATNSSMTAVP